MLLHEMHNKKIEVREVSPDFEQICDVLIAGLGTGGAVSLITAAKLGLNVLGIERQSSMGGTGTLGAINAYYFGNRGGAYEEINKSTAELTSAVAFDKARGGSGRIDSKAYVLEREALRLGAHILYESEIVGVFTQASHVVGARVYSEGKVSDIKSTYIIDGTGDASICALVTDNFRYGRDYDGKTQPYSNIAIRFKDGHFASENKDAGYVDSTDPHDMTRAFIDGALQSNCYAADYTKVSAVITNASLLGCREGRKIVSEDDLIFEQFIGGKKADEPLFYTYSNLDNHAKDIVFEDKLLRDWYGVCGLWSICTSVGVPIGALIPKGLSGIAVCGRAIGADHNMSSCVRMKRDVEKCGEALATAISVAISDNTELLNVDYKKLTPILENSGCLDKSNDVGLLLRTGIDTFEPFEWLTDEGQIIDALSTDSPGVAIWSCRRIGKSVADTLYGCLDSKCENLRCHSALALGIIGDMRACAPLREMASKPDLFIPKSSIKYVQTRSVSAIALLGELADEDAVDILAKILSSNGSFDESGFVPDELYASPSDMRFEHVSFALWALCEIYKSHPNTHGKIKNIILQSVFCDSFEAKITLKFNTEVVYDFRTKMREYAKRALNISDEGTDTKNFTHK